MKSLTAISASPPVGPRKSLVSNARSLTFKRQKEEGNVNWKDLDDGQLLTVDEVAEWLRLEKPYVYRLARTGELHRVYLGARYVRIPAGAVRAYITANMVDAEELRSKLRSRPRARRPGARARRLQAVRDAER